MSTNITKDHTDEDIIKLQQQITRLDQETMPPQLRTDTWPHFLVWQPDPF